MIVAAIFALLTFPAVAQDVVDATTMNNKVMAGYQGWFRTPDDRSGNQGWAHLFNAATPSPEKLAFDIWPDMSELSKAEEYIVPGFSYSDKSPAYLYSAQNPKTVLRHFQWMKTYGIDGVWLSEFCGHFPGAGGERDAPNVQRIMENVRKAATATGRTWAFMWDMSGFGPKLSKQQVFDIIINQWKKMVDDGITGDTRYLHQNGKPVLLLWGFFPNRPASQPDYMTAVLDSLLAPGKYQATLVGGVDPNWRSLGTPEFQAMLMRMQAIQPWSVGRRIKDPATGYDVQNTSLWEGDIAKCKVNHVVFIPVFNAGTNVAGPPPVPPKTPTVPRRMGNYLWEQFVKASKIGGINSAFIAMFDEINEGTQIMKIDIHPPIQAPFLTYDGATGDYYLRLVGAGAKLLKTGNPITPILPVSPFDEGNYYRLVNTSSNELLGHTEWQIIYEPSGYYRLVSKNSNGKLTFEENSEWHFEWDGTGSCQLISKRTGKKLGLNGQYEENPPAGTDHWMILPD